MSIKLTDYEISADLGRNYTELTEIYRDWSFDLHKFGNILSSDKLKIIFSKGLMLWYIQYYLKKNGLYDNTTKITHIADFYDFYIIMSFLKKINHNILKTFPSVLLQLSDYYNYQIAFIKMKLESYRFMNFIEQNNYNEYLHKISEIINEQCNKIKKICEDKSLSEFCYSILDNTIVVRLGIVFQRWKIVLEKMNNVAKDKNDEFMKSMYVIDKLLNKIQEIICTYVNDLVNEIINSIEYCYDNKIKLNESPEWITSNGDYIKIIKIMHDDNHFLHKPQLLENLDLSKINNIFI